jgi:hypothetical protein
MDVKPEKKTWAGWLKATALGLVSTLIGGAIQDRIKPSADSLIGKVYTFAHSILVAPAPVWTLLVCLLGSAGLAFLAARRAAGAEHRAADQRIPQIPAIPVREEVEGLSWVAEISGEFVIGLPMPHCPKCDNELRGLPSRDPRFANDIRTEYACDNPACRHAETLPGTLDQVIDRARREIQRRLRQRRAAG